MYRIKIARGDITQLEVDAIVNAANSRLAGGGGVDGAIHRAAGPELLQECLSLGGCPTGSAKITHGYRLKAAHVIHAVGPVWHGGDRNEAEDLAGCYRRSLELAVSSGLKSIAFSAISCGAYGFPIDRAASIAVNEIAAFLAHDNTLEQVLLVCFDNAVEQAFESALRELKTHHCF